MSKRRRRLLICTIARNCVHSLETWANQISLLAFEVREQYDVDLSIYENDSTDGTKELLAKLWTNVFPTCGLHARLHREDIGTQQYGSVWSVDRLRNLAKARQHCLDQVHDLTDYDKIAFIEPDVTYDPEWCKELILARHPAAAGLGDPDIYSGWSLRSEKHPKESTFLYDTCATRQRDTDTSWDFAYDGGGTWRADSLVPTNLSHYDSNCLHKVWSTFNCFCVYNAKPFINGLCWGYINRRLDNGQQRVEDGWLEADTVKVCEDFRILGHDKIYLNTNCLVRHN